MGYEIGESVRYQEGLFGKYAGLKRGRKGERGVDLTERVEQELGSLENYRTYYKIVSTAKGRDTMGS